MPDPVIPPGVSRIDYTVVTREVRGIISRRRELLTFLGTAFAALGIFLQNVLQGGLPPSLSALKSHLFAFYAVMLMVPSLIIALRLARLNMGMTINGILYQRLMQGQDFVRKGTPESMKASARVNPAGVSFLMFLLSAILAGFSATLLGLASGLGALLAVVAGAVVVLAWFGLYLWFHFRAAAIGLRRAAAEPCTTFTRDEWEAHTASTLSDANHDMTAVVALAALIVFSGFEALSGLGRVADAAKTGSIDLPPEQVLAYGPLMFGVVMMLTCLFGLVTYIRLRMAVGARSLDLDPNDQPFRPLRLTDSLLGYMLLAFLFVVSLHVLLDAVWFSEERWWNFLIGVDAVAFAAAIAAEQVSLVVMGWKYKRS